MNRTTLPFLLPALMAVAAVTLAEEWMPLDGPPGADVRSFAAGATSPHRVYATDFYGGLFVSADRGASWRPCRDGLGPPGGSTCFLTVTVDPVDEAKVYTGSTDGLYQSVDSGATWQRILDGVVPWETAVCPSDNDRLVVGATTGLFSSTDGGATWSFDRAGYIYCVRFDPLHPDTVLAFDNTAGVLRSTDAGASWNLISTALPAGRNLLRFDPATPGLVYALAANASNTNAVYKSTNGGATWTLKFSLDRWLNDIALDRQDPRHIWLAGNPPDFELGAVLWHSTDRGESWNELRLPTTGYHYVPYARSVTVDPADGNNVIVAIPWVGLLRSTDRGASWSASSIPGSQLQYFVRYDTDAGCIYTSTVAGNLWRVTPGGSDWTRLTDSTHSRVQDLAINPQDHRELFIATAWDGAVFRSTDAGANWSMTSLYGVDASAVAIAADAPNVLLAGVTNPAPPYGVYVSRNSGVTWGKRIDGQFGNVAVHPVSADTMLAANAGPMGEQTRIYRSTDQGETWSVVYVEGSGGPGCANLAFDPQSPNVVYASSFYHGVLRSTDGGGNWSEDVGGLQGRGTIRDIRVDPENGDVYLSLTESMYSGEMYRSTDRGDSWTVMSNEGRWPVNTAVWCIDVQHVHDSLALVVGTRGCGLYSWGRLPSVGVREFPGVPGRASVLAVRPNPVVGGEAILRVRGFQGSRVRVTAHDASGRSVLSRSLVIGDWSFGIPLDVRGLSSGIYLVRVESDTRSASGKLVIQ